MTNNNQYEVVAKPNAVANPGHPSVINAVAQRYGMDKAAFVAVLKASVFPKEGTPEQLAAFLLIANEYNLNPVLKEIHAFIKNGAIQPIVGIDGWCKIINSNPQFNGFEFKDNFSDNGQVVSITCKMYRKDREHAVEATEYLSECKGTSIPWTKWPVRMLRHKALIQAARYAFGYGGILDPDEAERMIDVSPTSVVEPPLTGNEGLKAALAKGLKPTVKTFVETPETIDETLREKIWEAIEIEDKADD